MGALEGISKKNTRRRNLKRVVLGTVALAGLIGVSLLAPNSLQYLKKLGMLPGKRQKESINACRDRLIRRGFVEYHGRMLRLTRAGEIELRRMGWSTPEKPKKWDGKWRVLIFDIPERKKSQREKVRRTLTNVGFVRLQDSVWLYPYDCEDLITLLKADFHIGRDVLYLIVDMLEYDRPYRKMFNLSLE